MQKKVIALAVAALASSAAFAQTNVTIYGVADMYYGHVTAKGDKAVNALNSGGLAGSRIGFKGVEDLGNGLKALFTLEYGLALDQNSGLTDQASNQARQQFVGLTSDKLGTVVAGYLQTTAYDFACAANPLAGGALDGYNLISGGAAAINCGAKGRASNAIAYISPSFAGLTFAYNHARLTEGAIYDTGTVDADLNPIYARENKELTANMVSLAYANGPLSAGAIYSRIGGNDHGMDVVNYSLLNNASVTTASTLLNNNKGINEWGLRASYDFKVAKLFTSYQRENNKNVDGQNSKWQISASIPTTATGAAHVMFAQNKMRENTIDKDTSRAYSLAYTHGLSKRTTLYAGYTRISNQDNAKVGAFGIYDAYNANAYDSKLGLVPQAGESASVFAMGVNHKF